MSDYVKQSLDFAINTAQSTLDQLFDTLNKTSDLVVASGESVLKVGDKTMDQVLAEMRSRAADLFEVVRSAGDTIAGPLP